MLLDCQSPEFQDDDFSQLDGMNKTIRGTEKYLRSIKTSPPSAREAAMSAMQHETTLKYLEKCLETFLKHFGNNIETSMKYS